MKDIVIFGAGGFGREVQMLIEQINIHSPNSWNFLGYFDDQNDSKGKMINGYPILGGSVELNHYSKELYIVFAIGDPLVKRKIINNLKNDLLKFPVIIHPTVQIGSMQFNEIGEGTIITSGCIITINCRIGKHVILNLGCTVGHDTVIGDYCSFMPAVNISGEVTINENVYVGTGAKIINQLEIGEGTIVGAGAVVSKTLPKNCTAVGIPAKPIKFHE